MSNEFDLELEWAAIKDHSLEVEDTLADHDTIITIQAQKLMEVGFLEYETANYGTAYYKGNDIHYYVCEKEESMEKFMDMCLKENVHPAPVKYYYKRYDLLKDTDENVKRQFKYEVAEKVQTAYPKIFFDAVVDLTEPISANSAYALLKEMTEQLDSCFDTNQLQLFAGLLEMMLKGRQLSYEGFLLLRQWLDNEYEKIAVEPVASGIYRRTFSGFAYQEPGKEIKYYCDAFPYMAKEKQLKFINKGYTVTPILTKTYYGGSYKELDQEKKNFENDLRTYVGSQYIALMELLKKLPATVDAEKYQAYKASIAETGSRQAVDAFQYYGYLWNIE